MARQEGSVSPQQERKAIIRAVSKAMEILDRAQQKSDKTPRKGPQPERGNLVAMRRSA